MFEHEVSYSIQGARFAPLRGEEASECNADHPADGIRERRLQSTQGNERGWRAETRQLSTVLHTALAHASPATWRSAGLTSSPSPSPKKEHFPSYDLPSKVLYLHSNAQDHQVRHKAFWRGRSVGEKRGAGGRGYVKAVYALTRTC